MPNFAAYHNHKIKKKYSKGGCGVPTHPTETRTTSKIRTIFGDEYKFSRARGGNGAIQIESFAGDAFDLEVILVRPFTRLSQRRLFGQLIQNLLKFALERVHQQLRRTRFDEHVDDVFPAVPLLIFVCFGAKTEMLFVPEFADPL